MPEWNKTPKFLKLQKSWYKKLAKSGFVDEEQDETYLKQPSGIMSLSLQSTPNLENDTDGRNDRRDAILSQASRQLSESPRYKYYASCRSFIQKYVFKNKKDRQIFEFHTEGFSIRDIEIKTKVSRRKVHETIKRLVKVMRNE